MRKFTFVIITIFCVLYSSCDKPRCENQNSIYINNAINSKEYNDELVRELSNEENVTFWLKEVISENDMDYLQVYIYNKNICTVGQFLVKNWSSIEGIRETNGVGYRNAQLYGFAYSITYTKSETILNFERLIRIID